jgi:glucan 1,3-beta-glucosidase
MLYQGVNVLRIPTTYSAWVDIGSDTQLYHGNQQVYLQTITEYAISTYGMRVIIGLHSLPGGVNSLDIGEAFGHSGWFGNNTNLAWSFDAIDGIISFIQNSGNPWAFTIAPINEASDNFAGFATAEGMTTNGTDWIVTYINGVLERLAAVDSRIPIMLQDSFLGEEHWSPYFSASSNIVVDSHIYYFAAAGIYSEYIAPAICGQSSVAGGDGKFPVFIGEWSVQSMYNNTFQDRESIFNTERYAWSKYVQGGSFWNIKYDSDTAVSGDGGLRDYWDYLGLIDAGVIKPVVTNSTYC